MSIDPNPQPSAASMVERVARAIHASSDEVFKWEHLSRIGHERFFRAARAAIEAMREPTEGMVSAGGSEVGPKDSRFESSEDCARYAGLRMDDRSPDWQPVKLQRPDCPECAEWARHVRFNMNLHHLSTPVLRCTHDLPGSEATLVTAPER